jgi:DNA-binding MltR family transcriptional regulator
MASGISVDNDAEKSDQSLSDLNRFLSLIRTQDDRALVLSLAAFVEETLGRLLLAYFRDCKATKDLVEGFNAPLGTLSSRIKSTYSFGLVTHEQYKDMDLLRKIRNKFAHDWEGISLDHNDIRAMTGELSGYTFDGRAPDEGVRERLLATLSTCCIELQVFVGRLESGKVEKAPDVSHRLATTPYNGPSVRRVVE